MKTFLFYSYSSQKCKYVNTKQGFDQQTQLCVHVSLFRLLLLDVHLEFMLRRHVFS